MADTISTVVGLGNPGADYVMTRHNVGWWFVDAIADACGERWTASKKLFAETATVRLAGEQVRLIKPQTFMNKSGQSIRAVSDFYKVEPGSILVVHDELDLPVGDARLKRGGGHGGHNGLRDTIRHIGADFARLRLGIGHPGDKSQVLGYVLKRASAADEDQILDAITRSFHAVESCIRDGWDKGVQRLHTKR